MLKIRKYKETDRKHWDYFVGKSNNGTIFHLRRFLNYHPENRFNDHSLIIKKKQKIFAVFPGAEKQINNKKHLISHPGLSFGSFVVQNNLSVADSYKMIEKFTGYLKKLNFKVAFIKLSPLFHYQRPSNYIDFFLLKSGFKYKNRELTSVLSLEDNIKSNLIQFRSSHIRGLKIAKRKGVKIFQSVEYEEFYRILKRNLSKRHGVSPTHTLKELKRLKSLFPEQLKLFSAKLDNKMIAGVLNFIINKRVVLAFYISHDEEYKDYRPLNFLFYKIFEWAIYSQYKVYDFGTFTLNQEPNMGLGRYKENFGASGVFRDLIEMKLS